MTRRKIILGAVAFGAVLVLTVVVTLTAFPGYERIGGPGKIHWDYRWNWVQWPLPRESQAWRQRKSVVVTDEDRRRRTLCPDVVEAYDLEIVGHDGTVYRDSGDRAVVAPDPTYMWLMFLASRPDDYLIADGPGVTKDLKSKSGKRFDGTRPRRIRLVIGTRFLFQWDRDEGAETGR